MSSLVIQGFFGCFAFGFSPWPLWAVLGYLAVLSTSEQESSSHHLDPFSALEVSLCSIYFHGVEVRSGGVHGWGVVLSVVCVIQKHGKLCKDGRLVNCAC